MGLVKMRGANGEEGMVDPQQVETLRRLCGAELVEDVPGPVGLTDRLDVRDDTEAASPPRRRRGRPKKVPA